MATARHDSYDGLGYYRSMGYVPEDKNSSSVSKTLEYAYDDWCIAQLAQKLGRTDIYEEFSKRAQNYKNVYDARIGFIKIDVNGAELLAMRGALQLLQRDRPFVLLECTRSGLDAFGFSAGQVHSLLVDEAGMRIQLLKDWLDGNDRRLDPDAFAACMVYPFTAFNFAVTAVPRRAAS